MPCLVAMTPTAMRARRSVRGEIRASCACRSIHEAGMGRPSRSIVRSQAAARSCLGEGRVNGMEGEGAGTGVRIGEPGDLAEGINPVAVAVAPIGAGGTWGITVELGCSTIIPRLK